MEAMEASVTDLLEDLKKLEDLTNEQINELASVRQDILSVKWKLTLSSEKSKEFKSSLNSSLELLSSKQFDFMLLEQREKTLKDQILPEKKNVMDTENSSLEQLHNNIWQARRDFCERVKEFSTKDGFLALNCDTKTEEQNELVNPELLPKVNDEELDLMEGVIASLETELVTVHTDLSILSEKHASANDEIEMLTNEPSVGTDFIRLQEAHTYCQNQVDLMESRCKKVQEEINSNEKLIQSLTLERKAAEASSYHDPHVPKNKYSNQNLQPQKYSAQMSGKVKSTGYTDNMSVENSQKPVEKQDSQTQCKRKTASKVTFACDEQYNSDRENKHTEILLRAEKRLNEIKSARSVGFATSKGDAGKLLKTGVTGDWRRVRPALPKASVTEDLALGPIEIPKKMGFVPKNPSGVALKLSTGKKSLPGFKKYWTTIGQNKCPPMAQKVDHPILAKCNRDEVVPLKSTAETETPSVEKSVESTDPPSFSRPSILKPVSRMPYIS